MTTLFFYVSFRKGGTGGEMLIAIAFGGAFCSIGAFLLFQGWSIGRRESAVAVAGDRLLVVQTGLRGTRRHEWSTSEITTVHVGPSGWSVNDQPVVELQIEGRDGKLFGMLAGRDARELAWMATLLRQTLKTTAPSSPQSMASDEGESDAQKL